MTMSPPAPRANPELLGQDAAVTVLSRALASGRLPHGWLLTGPPGIGKATLAYRFTRALLAGPDMAGPRLALAPDHPVFRQVAERAHPDLTVIEAERDPKTGRVRAEITVDAVRAATAALRATAASGGARVALIDGAETLNRNAANALLKTLEEPPPGAILILISHRPGRVAATLKSRCAKLRLAPLPADLVAAALGRLAPDLDGEQRRALALLARGSIGRALALAEGDWLGLYRRLADGLASDPPDRLALHEVAGALARTADGGSGAALAVLQELLGRVVALDLGRLGPALFAGEPEVLARLAAGRPLDRWAALWEKIDRLAAAVDGLNLDRGHALMHMLTLLTPAWDLGSAGGALPGGGLDGRG